MKSGTYTKGEKKKDFFLKKIQLFSKIEEDVYYNLNFNSIEIVNKYEADINKLGIPVAKIYDIYFDKNIMCIKQEFIDGKTIDEIINDKNFNLELKIKIIKSMFDLFELSFSNYNIRIDWNLNNFIFKNDKIILVDLIPSLYIDKLIELKDKIDPELINLYTNYDIQLSGMLCYICRGLLYLEKVEFDKYFDEICFYAHKIIKINLNKKNLFIKKLKQFIDYRNGVISYEVLINNYNNLSLSNELKRRKK